MKGEAKRSGGKWLSETDSPECMIGRKADTVIECEISNKLKLEVKNKESQRDSGFLFSSSLFPLSFVLHLTKNE